MGRKLTLQHDMNRKAGTLVNGIPTRDAQGAANVWAGTTGLGIVGALNTKAGNTITGGGTLSPPTLSLGATGAGAFAAGTYFWKVTAVNYQGETVGSNEVSAALTLNQSKTLDWTAVTGASKYRLYRGTAAGAENTRVTETTALTFTDTGGAGTAAAPPASNSAAVLAYLELQGVLNQLAGTTGLGVDGAAAMIP